MTRSIEVDRFLEDLSGRYAKPYTEAIGDMVVAETRGNRLAYTQARNRLDAVMTQSMGISEILGATMALQTASKLVGDSIVVSKFQLARAPSHGFHALAEQRTLLHFASKPSQAILPRVTLAEAVEDMIERSPVTIKDAAERTARNIAKLYSEGRVTAFVRSAEQAVTKRVQGLILEVLRTGQVTTEGGGILVGEGQIGRGISMSVDAIRKETGAWTDAYSRMVFRTNMNTAVTAGRWKQGLDPDIADIMPAVQFMTSGDVDVRPTAGQKKVQSGHRAGNGKIMLRTNRAWNMLSSPLDYG